MLSLPFFCPQKRYNFLEKLDSLECENCCVHMYDIFPYSPRKCVEFLTLPSHLGYNTVQKIDAHHLFPLFWTRASCILVRKIEEHTCHYFPLWDLRIRLFLHSSPPNPQTDKNFYNCTCCYSGARKTERKLWLWKILKIGWPRCMMRGDNLRSSRCDLIFYVTKKKKHEIKKNLVASLSDDMKQMCVSLWIKFTLFIHHLQMFLAS